jgi:membrane dipeptidase
MTEPSARARDLVGSTPSERPVRIDGHLDLAFNAVGLGRDLGLPLDELRVRESRSRQTAMITWPELRAADVDVVFGTLYAKPQRPRAAGDDDEAPTPPGYHDAQGAFEQARAQLDWYERSENAGFARLIRDRRGLETHLRERANAAPEARRTGVVVLMEGADPVRTPDDLERWWSAGVRLLGPAWGATRYAGGTGAPGGLTDLGVELVRAMAELGLPLDVSHLAEASFWQALEHHDGVVFASHANARALTPTDRHLSDPMLDALGERNGVVGLVLGNAFIDPSPGPEGVTLASVTRQAEHVASRIGWSRVAIGSDLDGGFGLEETPRELTRGGNFDGLAAIAPAEHRRGVLGDHWLRFLRRALPDP